MRRNLSPDPAEGGNPPPAPTTKPKTPAIVKRTPVKTPSNVPMEKELARLRDEVDQLTTKVKSTDDFLASLQLGKPTPPPQSPQRKSFLDELWNSGKA